MANILGKSTLNGILIVSSSTTPLTGGVSAPIGSFCLAIDGSGMFSKFGSGDTDWIQSMPLGISVSGTDTYVGTFRPNLTAYTTGFQVSVTFTNANTGASTINFNSLGTKSIVKGVSTALVSGDIPTGTTLLLLYDGTNFVIVGSNIFAPTSSASTIIKMTSDLPNSGTTTNQTAITELIYPVLANSIYVVKGFLRMGCSSTGGSRLGFLMPTSALFYGNYKGKNTSSTTYSDNNYDGAGSGLVGGVVNAAAAISYIQYNGMIYTGATAGNFQLLFTSVTSPQVTTIYYNGSYMEIIKVG